MKTTLKTRFATFTSILNAHFDRNLDILSLSAEFVVMAPVVFALVMLGRR